MQFITFILELAHQNSNECYVQIYYNDLVRYRYTQTLSQIAERQRNIN